MVNRLMRQSRGAVVFLNATQDEINEDVKLAERILAERGKEVEKYRNL